MIKLIDDQEYYRIEIYPDYYISKMGKIYSEKSKKVLKNRCDRYPFYEKVILTINGKNVVKSVHRLVAIQFIDNPDSKSDVNHIDGNKLNNCVDNLEWLTHKENMQHAWDIGLMENSGWTKISKESKDKRKIGCRNRSRLGLKHSKETKKKMSDKKIGSNHPKFKGMIVTPIGEFESSYDAGKAENLSHRCIQYRCKSKNEKFKDYYVKTN